MAQDDVAFAFIGARGHLTRRWKFNISEKMAELMLSLLPAMDGSHPALSLSAQIGRATGIQARGRGSKFTQHHQPHPGRDAIKIMRTRDQGSELCAGWPGAYLRNHHMAVTTAEPFHMAHAVFHTEHLQGAKGYLADVVILRCVDLTRHQHTPLHPGRAHHLQR